MEVTRQYWTYAGVGLFLASWGVILAQPLVLLGSAGVAAWLVSQQFRFVRTTSALSAELTVQVTGEEHTVAEETSQLSLEAMLDRPSSQSIDITAESPVGVSGTGVTISLEPGERKEVGFTTLTWPVAGSFAIGTVTATFSDGRGLFRQTIDFETGFTVEVEPRAPRDLHIGAGGQPIAVGFGEHETGQLGSGIEPAEIREYLPGDSVRQIDWKATARQNHPHVQEFEGETDRETHLFFDHRATMSDGRSETRKLDYARQLALAIVNYAHQKDDELGYYAIGDDGLTTTVRPGGKRETWRPIREQLLGITPTRPGFSQSDPVSPATIRTTGARLQDDDTPFTRTLAPYFADRHAYHQRFDDLPLYSAVTNSRFTSSSIAWLVIITDDSHRAELRETVKYARSMADNVTVFLTPTALFTETDITDLDREYDRYASFEEFRRELARMGRVSAYEVGPADRLSAILSGDRDRPTRGTA